MQKLNQRKLFISPRLWLADILICNYRIPFENQQRFRRMIFIKSASTASKFNENPGGDFSCQRATLDVGVSTSETTWKKFFTSFLNFLRRVLCNQVCFRELFKGRIWFHWNILFGLLQTFNVHQIFTNKYQSFVKALVKSSFLQTLIFTFKLLLLLQIWTAFWNRKCYEHNRSSWKHILFTL